MALLEAPLDAEDFESPHYGVERPLPADPVIIELTPLDKRDMPLLLLRLTDDGASRSPTQHNVAITISSDRTDRSYSFDDTRNDILDATYRFSECGKVRVAVDWIIDKLDDLLNDGQFILCNSVLRSADPDKLDDALIVTMLGITLAAKDKLTSRPVFYHNALYVVTERRGEEGAEHLLGKYR